MSTQIDLLQNINPVSAPNVKSREKTTMMILVSKDHQWNLNSVNQVAREARAAEAEVVLVKMVPVQHMGLLGTEWGYMSLTEVDVRQIESYEATLEDYGVMYSHTFYQYMDFLDALIDVADFLNAQVVYTRLEKSRIPCWAALVRWYLNMRLSARDCKLIDLNEKSVPASYTSSSGTAIR